MKIGRYRIVFGGYAWIQTTVPTTVRRFLCSWFFKEARPHDVDKKQQFPLGTPMEHEGRVYHYWKAGEDINKGKYVGRYEVKH
ncbi:hypothetical protein ES703_120002 [subsurface metagenome]